jgi:hypothetical protein
MNVIIPYHPSKPQRLFHETEADEVGYGGELGGGKTKALAMEGLLSCLKYPATLYCFRATYQQGSDTLFEEMERSYPPELARYNKEDNEWHWITGGKIKMRQCRTLEDAKKNDGKEFNKLLVDEAQHIPFDAFDYLCTRPRANKALGIHPQVKFTAMQGGKGHAWIKRNYIDPLEPNVPKLYIAKDEKTGEETEIYRQFIPASLEDNKHIDDKYVGRLNMRSDRLRKMARGNRWTDVEGQSFPEWVDRPYLDSDQKQANYKGTHVIPAFEVPAHWPIYRGFDYGRAKPYSALWFTRGDDMYGNRLYLIHELYGGTEDEEGLNETVSQIAEKIAAVEKPLAQKHGWITGIADPSIFSKSPYEQEESIASVMEQHGVVFEDPHYNKDVGVNVINNRFQGKQLIHEALLFDAEGYPGLQVFDCCKKFRQHFPELVTDPKNPDDVDSEGTADHDYDACLAGETLIWTDKGKLPISRLAGTNGRVYSSDGKLHEYSECRRTRRSADVFEIELEDGTIFKATANHPVMLKNGEYVCVRDLKAGDDVKTIGGTAR